MGDEISSRLKSARKIRLITYSLAIRQEGIDVVYITEPCRQQLTTYTGTAKAKYDAPTLLKEAASYEVKEIHGSRQ